MTAPPPHTSAPPPGLLRRFAAFVYDALLIVALLMVFTFAVVLVRGGRAVPPGTWWFGPSLLLVTGAFFCWFWSHGGQTLGMRAWRIRVERRDGGPLGPALAALRYLAAWLSALAAGCGFWWSLLDPERRCWHDLLCGTRVVRLPKLKKPPPAAPPGPPAA